MTHVAYCIRLVYLHEFGVQAQKNPLPPTATRRRTDEGGCAGVNETSGIIIEYSSKLSLCIKVLLIEILVVVTLQFKRLSLAQQQCGRTPWHRPN